MRIVKQELCGECRDIHPRMDDGNHSGHSVGSLLDSEEYQHPIGYVMINQAILHYLMGNGGCERCIGLLRRATDPEQW